MYETNPMGVKWLNLSSPKIGVIVIYMALKGEHSDFLKKRLITEYFYFVPLDLHAQLENHKTLSCREWQKNISAELSFSLFSVIQIFFENLQNKIVNKKTATFLQCL